MFLTREQVFWPQSSSSRGGAWGGSNLNKQGSAGGSCCSHRGSSSRRVTGPRTALIVLNCLDLKLWSEKPSCSSRAGACGGLSCSCVAALVRTRLCAGGWTRARAGGVSRPGAGHHTFCLQAALTRGSRSCRGGGWGGSSQLRPVQ